MATRFIVGCAKHIDKDGRAERKSVNVEQCRPLGNLIALESGFPVRYLEHVFGTVRQSHCKYFQVEEIFMA
ncbi:MAG: hypothetical protein WCQ50_19995 [Spirochaetota bacterium]